MRVLVTGASGHLGSAVVPELIAAGHAVVGLARSPEAAARLGALGAEARAGYLDDFDVLRDAASGADGVIHLAFRHDAMQVGDMAGAAASDLAAITAMANLNRIGTEEDVLSGGYRIDAENLVIGLAERGVRSVLIRLPPTVHSSLDHHGFIPGVIASARRNGVSVYVGDGENRWPAVHTLDAARLYRLALEGAPAGTRLHAVAEEGIPFREIAERIGQRLGVPAISVSPDDAPNYVGFLAPFVAIDSPASSRRTRELLGWSPMEPGLLEDLATPHYFAEAAG